MDVQTLEWPIFLFYFSGTVYVTWHRRVIIIQTDWEDVSLILGQDENIFSFISF